MLGQTALHVTAGHAQRRVLVHGSHQTVAAPGVRRQNPDGAGARGEEEQLVLRGDGIVGRDLPLVPVFFCIATIATTQVMFGNVRPIATRKKDKGNQPLT